MRHRRGTSQQMLGRRLSQTSGESRRPAKNKSISDERLWHKRVTRLAGQALARFPSIRDIAREAGFARFPRLPRAAREARRAAPTNPHNMCAVPASEAGWLKCVACARYWAKQPARASECPRTHPLIQRAREGETRGHKVWLATGIAERHATELIVMCTLCGEFNVGGSHPPFLQWCPGQFASSPFTLSRSAASRRAAFFSGRHPHERKRPTVLISPPFRLDGLEEEPVL